MAYFPHADPLPATGDDQPVSLKAAILAIALLSLGLWTVLWLVANELS